MNITPAIFLSHAPYFYKRYYNNYIRIGIFIKFILTSLIVNIFKCKKEGPQKA